MYNPYAVGKRVYLRHPTVEDVEGGWHEWFSDEETTKWLGLHQWPNSVENQWQFYEAQLKSRDRMVLSIAEIDSDLHIGVCNLSSISWVHHYCDLAVVIGMPDFRSGPYVIDVMSLLLRIAFLRLNLRIVKGGYLACNKVSKAILDVFRFKEVGRYPELIWCDGKFTDSVMVMLHRDSWMRRNNRLS